MNVLEYVLQVCIQIIINVIVINTDIITWTDKYSLGYVSEYVRCGTIHSRINFRAITLITSRSVSVSTFAIIDCIHTHTPGSSPPHVFTVAVPVSLIMLYRL